MKNTTIHFQRGAAAVEFAILGALLTPVFMLGLLVTHLAWEYNVLRAATANAARFLAIRSPVPFEERQAIATAMIEETARNSGIALALPVQVTCDTTFLTCNSAATRVTVAAATASPAAGEGTGVAGRAVAGIVR